MENDVGTRILLNRSLTVLSEMYMDGRGHYLGKVIFDPYEPPDKGASLYVPVPNLSSEPNKKSKYFEYRTNNLNNI